MFSQSEKCLQILCLWLELADKYVFHVDWKNEKQTHVRCSVMIGIVFRHVKVEHTPSIHSTNFEEVFYLFLLQLFGVGHGFVEHFFMLFNERLRVDTSNLDRLTTCNKKMTHNLENMFDDNFQNDAYLEVQCDEYLKHFESCASFIPVITQHVETAVRMSRNKRVIAYCNNLFEKEFC